MLEGPEAVVDVFIRTTRWPKAIATSNLLGKRPCEDMVCGGEYREGRKFN